MTMDELKKVAKELKEVTDALERLRKATSELEPELQQKLLDLFFIKEKDAKSEVWVYLYPQLRLTLWDRDLWGNELSAGVLLDVYLAALDSRIRDFLLRERIGATEKVGYIEDTRRIYEDIEDMLSPRSFPVINKPKKEG